MFTQHHIQRSAGKFLYFCNTCDPCASIFSSALNPVNAHVFNAVWLQRDVSVAFFTRAYQQALIADYPSMRDSVRVETLAAEKL